MRKHLVEYDDVVNKHRESSTGSGQDFSGADLRANLLDMVKSEVRDIIAEHTAMSMPTGCSRMASRSTPCSPSAGSGASSPDGEKGY